MGLIDRLQNQKREQVFKELLGKKYSSLNDLDFAYSPMEEVLLISIKRLVMEGRINEAEDMLFDSISKSKTANSIYIAGEFYTMLSDMTDEQLKKGDFTREEIQGGINDIKKLF